MSRSRDGPASPLGNIVSVAPLSCRLRNQALAPGFVLLLIRGVVLEEDGVVCVCVCGERGDAHV